MKSFLKKSAMLLVIIILTSIINAKDIDACNKQLQEQEARNAGLLVSIEKCDDSVNVLEREKLMAQGKLEACEAKKKDWVVKIPFLDVGLETAEARGAIITLAGIYIHPICFGVLFF